MIVYCRTSTDKQDVSLEIQEETCRKEAEHLGFHVVRVVHETVSGEKLSNRPVLAKVRDDLDAGEADVLLVYQLGRLSRDPIHLNELCLRHKVRSVLDVIDTDSAFGTFAFRIQGAVLELERKLIGERTSRGLQKRKSEMRRYTHLPPYGFEWDDGRMVQHKDEYPWLKQMFHMRYIDELNYSQIARSLAESGCYNRVGNVFNHTTISRILARSPAREELAPLSRQ